LGNEKTQHDSKGFEDRKRINKESLKWIRIRPNTSALQAKGKGPVEGGKKWVFGVGVITKAEC